MARYSKTLTPAAQAGFLALLREGMLVEAAAARVGVAISSLYCRRRRDPAFDSEWTAAAEASFGFVWKIRKGRRGRGRGRVRVATRRRVRFGAARRAVYLASLGQSCDTKDSARRAGVRPSTVYRNLKRDPGFALANASALERGYVRLERLAALEQARAAERMTRFLDRGFEPTGEPTSDRDRLLLLLDRYRLPERRQGGRPGPGLRPALSPFESIEALELKLSRLDWPPGRPNAPRP